MWLMPVYFLCDKIASKLGEKRQKHGPINYSCRLCRSAWVGFSSPSVCLFVQSLTQNRMILKCSNLIHGMTLGYPTSGIVLG